MTRWSKPAIASPTSCMGTHLSSSCPTLITANVPGNAEKNGLRVWAHVGDPQQATGSLFHTVPPTAVVIENESADKRFIHSFFLQLFLAPCFSSYCLLPFKHMKKTNKLNLSDKIQLCFLCDAQLFMYS